MARTRLTSNLGYEMFWILVIPFLILALFWDVLDLLTFQIILVLILIFALFGYIFYYLYTMKTIEFDDDYIYFSLKNAEEKIPYQNIKAIKLSMGGMNGKDFWKLKYVDNNNALNKITFVPRRFDRELFKFQEIVKSKNPEAVIENFATSFDVDFD